MDKNYLMGLDLDSGIPLLMDDRMDGELVYSQMVERLVRFNEKNEEDIFE